MISIITIIMSYHYYHHYHFDYHSLSTMNIISKCLFMYLLRQYKWFANIVVMTTRTLGHFITTFDVVIRLNQNFLSHNWTASVEVENHHFIYVENNGSVTK